LKRYEKESFLKVFSIFFLTSVVLWGGIFYLYYEERKDLTKEDLYYQMKDYAFNFQGKKFSLDIIKKDKKYQISKIKDFEGGLVLYLPMPKSDKFILKIIYSSKKFKADLDILRYKVLKISLVILFIMFFFSLYFAKYSLKPIRNAVYLLEVFLKDLIHDLNTPVTSIMLNSRLLSKKEPSLELERIELSAKSISSLYKNLEVLKNQASRKMSEINIKDIIEQRVKILQKLYPSIKIRLKLEDMILSTSEEAISRILDNILTNACKYNKKNGEVVITANKNQIIIEDTGIGIKNTKRVFEQYYKENERGLGLGMNIVKRLCDELKIKIKIKSEINAGTKVELTLN